MTDFMASFPVIDAIRFLSFTIISGTGTGGD